MKWGSAISRTTDTARALVEVNRDARRMLDAESVDIALVFFSPHHVSNAAAALATLRRELPGAVITGCSAQSCIGGGLEVEQEPSFSLTLGCTPGASFHPFHVSPAAAAGAGNASSRWRTLIGVEPAEAIGFILLGDPFSGDSEALLNGVVRAYPGGVLIGGLASGAGQPGANVLALGDECFTEGHVGIAMTGDIAIDTIVAQGCRPIGEPMFVTRSEQNVIFEIDGRPPLEVLTELAAGATEREMSLFQTSLFVGQQMSAERMELGRGDFLVRNIIGGDRDSGAIAISAAAAERQVVQFQLRDGETATDDLRIRLEQYKQSSAPASAALLFSCLGRGEAMYGVPNHDTDALRHHLGDISVSGFFGNGEIGPVGGQPYLHGYTSAIALLRPAKS